MSDIFEKCYNKDSLFPSVGIESDHYFIEPRLEGHVSAHMTFQGKEKIIWSLNNYIGLADHPEITAVAQEVLKHHGMSYPMGSRMLSGDSRFHEQLEHEMAEFSGKPAAMLCAFGYLGVIGTIPSLVQRGDTVLIDSHSHACIVDAAIIAQERTGIRLHPFKHNQLDDLENQLIQIKKQNKGGILIVTEGVFGMHGDLGKLKDICDLKEKYGARLFVDDAHGFGVMGKNGRGTGEFFKVQDKIDIYFGTFTKAFGLFGGMVASETPVINYIKQHSRTAVFSRTMPLVVVQSIRKAIELATLHPEYREKMWHITQLLQNGLRELGFNIGHTESPITPLYIPCNDVDLAMRMTHVLRDEYHIFVSPITYPVIEKNIVLFRMTATASHTEGDVNATLSAFAKIREKFNLQHADKELL